jgi:hypothetical protein
MDVPYKQEVGSWGEELVITLLVDAGFTELVPLNERRRHHAGGDVLGAKDGWKWFFSVKARDRMGKNKKPNPSFNVYPNKVMVAAHRICSYTVLVRHRDRSADKYLLCILGPD